MKFGIMLFPGSNCDRDCFHALEEVMGARAIPLWHGEADLKGADCVVLPGGFSYGDYLRAGAMAALAPGMEAVREHAAGGRPVIGICNGFQILCEAGLLPGALRRNAGGRFRCEDVHLRVENYDTPFTRLVPRDKVLRLPIAHGEGNYYADPAVLNEMKARGQIVFRYVTAGGEPAPEANPNGSLENIAGVCSPAGNVLGMMPHPERSVEALLGSEDGLFIFRSLLEGVDDR